MAKTRKAYQRFTATPAKVYKAMRGNLGRVVRGQEITEAEAVRERRAGRDIVVCGGELEANRSLARAIEAQVGPYIIQPPHKRGGPFSLPHFQPDPRPPTGHSFYETSNLKAARRP
jgi:hypothetical protein